VRFSSGNGAGIDVSLHKGTILKGMLPKLKSSKYILVYRFSLGTFWYTFVECTWCCYLMLQAIITNIQANSHMPYHAHVDPMPCCVNSRMLCHAPSILQQYRIFRESPHGRRKYLNCYSNSLTDWYASDNNLRGRSWSGAGRPYAVSGQLVLIRPCSTVLWPWEVAFRTAWSWHDMCDLNTDALCKSDGKDIF
jgi:hypothetical protein